MLKRFRSSKGLTADIHFAEIPAASCGDPDEDARMLKRDLDQINGADSQCCFAKNFLKLVNKSVDG